MKLWLIPLNDKKGEELCTHMYNPFGRLLARIRVRINLESLGYRFKRNVSERGELSILDKNNNLIGKLKTVHYNKHNIEPEVLLNIKQPNYKLTNAILKAGCSIEYFN